MHLYKAVVNDKSSLHFIERMTQYTVKTNDTLWSISKRFGTTIEEIADLNGIKDINKIYVGQVLEIPE